MLFSLNCRAKEYAVRGPQGGIAMKVSLPEFIRCWGMMKLGREYLLSTQELDIYGTASAYKGPVLLLHGSEAVAFFRRLLHNPAD